MSDFELRGIEDLTQLTRALRDAGEEGKGLRKELYAGLNRETKKVRADMKEAIEPVLPKRGGLAADVQRTTRFSAATRGGGSNPGVRIRARGKRSIRRMNATGTWRHKVFGRNVWVTQSSPGLKGFLDKPFEKARPEVRQAVIDTIARVRSQLYRRI